MGATRVVAGMAVALALVAPATAYAGESSITVGPGRQMVYPEQGSVEVLISNTGDESMRVISTRWVHDASGWQLAPDLAMFAEPARFKLKPNEQQPVKVILPGSASKCSLFGMGWSEKPPKRQGPTMVSARGVAITQFAVAGAQGTEADCLAILPTPAPSTTTASGSPPNVGDYWWIVLLLAGAYGVYRTGSRVQARKYRKKVGSGFE